MVSNEDRVKRLRQILQSDPEGREFDLALGCMVHFAAMTEFFLYQLLRTLLDSKHAGSVTAAMQASAVLDAVKRIVDTGGFSDQAGERMKDLVVDARQAFTERNKYVHGLRFSDPGTTKTVMNKERRHGTYVRSQFTADDLYHLAATFQRLSGGFMSWQREHVEGIPPGAPRLHPEDEPAEPGE
ncbi:hypothetical protein ACFTS5_12890 [Nocardia sp. NPDC056952]|uniref:hypothetical protein n=1 Tax=Nocardia sp. NPDC056952 TaxID=3345979 RepID=UPI00362D4766